MVSYFVNTNLRYDMKRILSILMIFVMMLSLFSCGKDKSTVYTGKLGVYDAEVTRDGDNMTISFTITEKSSAMTVKNVVKIVGTIESSDGNKYTVNFSDENTVVTLRYVVTGTDSEGYYKKLAEFLNTVVKTDADKALVEKLGKGEEISFGIDSALYTSITGMPKTVNIKLYSNDNTFKVLN